MQPGRCNDGRCCGRDDGVLSHGSGCVRTALCTMPSTPSRGGYARQAVKTTRRYASRAHTVWWLAGMAARILSRCCYLFGDIKKSGGLHRCCGDAGRLDANLQRRRRISGTIVAFKKSKRYRAMPCCRHRVIPVIAFVIALSPTNHLASSLATVARTH